MCREATVSCLNFDLNVSHDLQSSWVIIITTIEGRWSIQERYAYSDLPVPRLGSCKAAKLLSWDVVGQHNLSASDFKLPLKLRSLLGSDLNAHVSD